MSREAILVRLVEVVKTVDASLTGCYRNDPWLNEEQQPFAVVMDGDEEADEADPVNRPTLAPRHVTMTPEVIFSVQEDATTLGTTMNDLAAKCINAVLSDAGLLAMTVNGRGVRYTGMTTGIGQGSKTIGEVSVGFAITYIMQP